MKVILNPFTGKLQYYPKALDFLVLPEIPEPAGVLDSAVLYAFDFHGVTQLYYKNGDGFLTNLGRDNLVVVANKTGRDIGKCAVVYVNGRLGNVPTVALAKADSETTMPSLGIVAEPIADNGFGRVTLYGKLIQCDTSGFTEGDVLYVSPATAGLLTNVKPGYPNIIQRVGIVLVSGFGNGTIEVDTQAMISTNVVPYVGAVTNVDLGARDLAAGVIQARNFISTVTTGTQPFACSSVTRNTNLNADQTDGQHLGITDAPQFARLGLGTLADAADVLIADGDVRVQRVFYQDWQELYVDEGGYADVSGGNLFFWGGERITHLTNGKVGQEVTLYCPEKGDVATGAGPETNLHLRYQAADYLEMRAGDMIKVILFLDGIWYQEHNTTQDG